MMHYRLRKEIGVYLGFDANSKKALPKYVFWQDRWRRVGQIGLHHRFRVGRTLIHAFSVVADETFMRLELDTETLHWYLTEVSDGLPD